MSALKSFIAAIGRKKVRQAGRKVFTGFVVFATIIWSLGISVLFPQAVYAALVVASGPFDLLPSGGMSVPNDSFDMPVMRVALTQSSSPGGETLDSITLIVTSTVVTNNATLASHIASLVVFRDSNGNNNFDPPNDAFAGTQGSVNVGAPTTITVSSNNSLAAYGAMPTSFFVAVKTAAGWAAGDSIYISMAADGVATSANSPTVTALTGTKAISFGGGGGGGWSGFSVMQVNQVNATTLDVTFTDTLGLNTGAATSTGNYILRNAAGVPQGISNITVLPDNESVRITAPTSTILTDGTWTLTVSANIKNNMGVANGNTGPMPIFGGVFPLLISEVKVGAGADPVDEFIEIYNRSEASVGTSSVKLHFVNAAGTADINVPLTFLPGSIVPNIPAHKFLLIAPLGSPASSTADAVYNAAVASLVPDGAVYISNSAATSTAVIDKVCWGAHAAPTNCEGQAASTLGNTGASLERKAFGSSTESSMTSGADAGMGNSNDTQNNNFDFISRATPGPQNSRIADPGEVPSGGSFGGEGNQAPNIQLAPLFRATSDSTLSLVARISDDGGTLPASNTQLIFCVDNTNTCDPVVPIYGISVGSGWYKFSPTTTPWSQGKSYFRYYLLAKDSASPVKTRVFTNDPNYDTVTYDTAGAGISSSATRIAKAVSINVVSGNLGSASISGTVNNNSAAAVSGATVWIEGTQFAATTGSDGTFSFANAGPSGGVQIKVAKDGYMDQSISTFLPSTGFVNLGTITLYSGMMGQGGDYSQPMIMGSFPMPNMMGFPTLGPGGAPQPLELNFNKSMDSATIADADASDAGSNIYLTEAGSGTKIAGAVTAPSATMARFTPTSSLTAGKAYTLFITPAVKDTTGNPVSGNSPGGNYILSFSTTGQMFENPGSITNFGMGNSFPPFVVGVQPAPGKLNLPLNTKVFVSFSEAMQTGATNLANVKLYQVSNPFTASESKTLVSTTNSADASNKIVILSPASSLLSSVQYRVEVLGGIVSSKGIPLGNPGSAGYVTNVMFKSDFTTGASSDTTAPTVSATIPAASATSVNTTKPIVISFSEAIDPSTITDSSVSVKLGSSAVSGNLSYDPMNRTATLVPNYALTASSTYTISVTTAVKDLAGVTLDQDSVTDGNQGLLQTFTTGSADLTTPAVVSTQANEFALKVVYSKPMLSLSASDSNYSASVTNPANYSIRVVNSSGVTQSTLSLPSTATITYDVSTRSAAINGLPTIAGFSAGSTLINTVISNVKDIGFNAIGAGQNMSTSTAQSSATTGNFSGGGMGGMPMMDAGGNMIQGGMMGGPPPMVGTYMDSGIGFVPGVKVFPFNTMAGAATVYGVEIPISKQIPASGYIDITFPEGTDVANAKKDPYSPPNNDINGPSAGVVVFATSEGALPTGWTTGGQASDGVIVNSDARKVRVLLGAVATRSEGGDTHDFLRLDIAQIQNSTITTGIDTSGSSATVDTVKSDGTILETLSSTSFFTSAAGSFSVRGQVKAGVTGLNGVSVFLMSPMTGPQTSSTASSRFSVNDGEFLFQNLVAGSYMLGVEQYFKVGATNYTASFPVPININAANCASNVCSKDISVTDASSGATVTLSISGVFSNNAVDIFAGGPGAFRMSTTTLNGTLTNNTSNSIKLNTNGVWMVGFGPSMSTQMFSQSGPMAPPSWMVPKPQQVTVTGCPSACAVSPSTLIFGAAAANKTIKFTVKDASGNAIGGAHVFAYSPGSGTGSDVGANADGTGSIGLSYGSYKIGADVAGMPGGIERGLLIKDDGGTDKYYLDGSTTGAALSSMVVADLILTISKPSYTISGKVTDGTNAVSGAPVNAYRTDGPGNANTFTNSSGEYTLYVNNGIWKVQAFTPDYGKLPEKTITVSGSSSSGQNFEPNTASVNYATFTKSVGNDTDSDGILESGEGVSNAQVTVEGTTSGGEHYINTVLTDVNGSSTLKLPPGTYSMTAWSPTQGDMSSTTQSIAVNSSGTVTTSNYDVLAPKTGAVTVNILDSAGNATSTFDAVIEFQQIGGQTDKVESFNDVSKSVLSLPVYDVGVTSTALGNVTSTNPNNYYLLSVNIPGIAQSDLMVYGDGDLTTMATSSAAAGLWKVEVDGAETINIKLPEVNYINGTVKDGNGDAVPNATVQLVNSSGEKLDVQADSSGNYTAKVSDGNYLMQASKDGYLDTATTVAITTDGAIADSAATIAATSLSITGAITANGSAVSGATVRGEKLGGGVVTATTNASGVYTLSVISGNWKVSASANGYTEKSYGTIVAVSSGTASGVDIALTTANSSLAGSVSSSVTPQTGGTLSDSSANLSVDAGESALASSANSYTLNEKETSNVVGGSVGTPIAGEAKEITGYDNDGNAVTLLNKDVSISISYSSADLASSLGTLTIDKLEDVVMGSWDTTSDNWQNLTTCVAYKDASGKFIEPSASASTVTYTGVTSHFSVFNPIAPADGLAPAAPTNVTASNSSGTVTVTWTAPTTNADSSALTDLLGYEIYRSTSANGTYTQLNTIDILTTSYADSVSGGTTYYYKVTVADTGGIESAYSTASNGVAAIVTDTPSTGGNSGGGGGATPTTYPTLGSTPVVLSAGGGTASTQTIALKFSATNAVQMVISETPDFAGSSWESYATTKNFTLSSGLGEKTVYVKFRSSTGGESAVKSIKVTLVEAAPGETITPPAETTAPAAGAAPISATVPGSAAVTGEVSNPRSAVVIALPASVSYQPTAKLKFAYKYQNLTNLAKIRITRQILNSKGKVVRTASATKSLKNGAVFSGSVDEAVKGLPAGVYTVRIRIVNPTSGKVLEENSFKITVEKLKYRTFKMGAVSSADSLITFDETLLSKVKSNVRLPANFKLKYSYVNNTEAKQTIRMLREVVDAKGKVVSTKTGRWIMTPGEKDSVAFTQPVAANLAVGAYTLRIRALDSTTKEVIAENSVGFEIYLK